MPNEKYPLALPEGTVLAGQFVIDEVLGQGGFGITYKATDHNTGEKVAIKEYYPDTMVSRTGTTVIPYTGERQENFKYGLDCFLREAETLAKYVDTDGIVSIKSYFEENGTAYFVMEYVEGESFEDYIKEKGGKISYEEAKNVLLPVIDALSCVHKDGIVHRDVTPDNIFITKDGQVRLLDFGAARYSIGDKSRSLDVVLKHGYAPKEQYTRHGKQGPFTDIYTVGVCFYRAITGKLPVDSIDRLEEDDVVLPSTLGVKIEPYEEEAILKAMAVQPADRFKSMEEFKAALLNEPVKEEAPVVAQPEETIKCPGCGAENKIGVKFCKECGTNMTEPVTTVQEFKTVAITPEQEVKPKKKKWLIPVVAVVILALLAVGGYFGVRYIDDQNYKSDIQLAKAIKTAVVTGMMDPDTYDDEDSLDFIEDVSDGKSFDITKWKASENYFTKDVAEILSIKEYSDLKNEIKTKGATGKIFVTIVSNEVMVEIEYSDRDNIVEGEISKKAWASLEEDDDTQVAEATPDPEPVADEPNTTVDPSPSPSATTTSSDKGEFEDLAVNNASNGGYVAYDNATGYEYYWLPGIGLCKLKYGESDYQLLDDTEESIFGINIVGDYIYYVKGDYYICSITKSGTDYTEAYLPDYFDDGDIYRWYINDKGFFAVIRINNGSSYSYELGYYSSSDGSPDTIYPVYYGNIIMSGDYIYWANSEDEMYCVKLEDFGVKNPNVIDFGDYGFSYSGYNLAAFDGYVYTVCNDTSNAGETYIVAMDNEGIQLWDNVTEANGLTVCDEGIYYYYTDWSDSNGNNTRIYSYPDALLYETEEGMRAWSITIAPCYGEEYSMLRVYGCNESYESGCAVGFTDGYGNLYYSY